MTLALGLLLAVAPPAIGQQPITHIYDALGRPVAVVDPITNEAAIYRYDAIGSMLLITGQNGAAVSNTESAPKSGPVGTTVTIYGTGFSSTPGDNSVTFSGTLAQVISATSTEIVTTVPAGAAPGLIYVTTAFGAVTSSEVSTVGTPGEPTISGFTPTVDGLETAGVPPVVDAGRIAVETPADRPASSSDFLVPPAPSTEGPQGDDGEAEPEDRSRRLDDPDAGPVMTEFIATVAVLAIVIGLLVILLMYASELTPPNCRVIIGVGVFANALMRKLRRTIDREDDERAKWKQTKPCEVEADDTLMMLKRCFEAQYRSLQPNLHALLKLHGADLPFITNPIPAGICARATALWWTDDVMVRKEQRVFMMVKEDVFLH